MKVLYMLVLAILASPLVSVAQSAGDFQTFQSGTWNNVSTWAEFNGSTWVNPAPHTPTSADGVITILSTHNVTVTASVTIDQTTVSTGATLTLSAGTLTTTVESQLVFQSGALYVHAENGGTIPKATWSSGSTCKVSGITNTIPAGLNPSGGFFNFTWDCPAQSAMSNFNGGLTNILGNLRVRNTNNQIFIFANSTAPSGPISIGGNFTVLGDSSVFYFTNIAAGVVVNIGGDFDYFSNGSSILKGPGSTTVNVAGNFNVNSTSGTLDMSHTSGGVTVNLIGNFTLASGTVTTSGGYVIFNFNKSGTQTFTNTGTIPASAALNYAISAGTTLALLGETALIGGNSSMLTVNGKLSVGSLEPTGAIVAYPTSVGSVRTQYRTYNPGSTVAYAGAGPQFIGSGQPPVASTGVTTEINNASGVTFNATTQGNPPSPGVLIIPGDLLLTAGNLNIDGTGGAKSVTFNGNITANGNFITTVGTVDMTINGTGALGTFPFPSGSQSLRNFTFNRTSSGSVTFTNNLTITNTTTITSGTVNFNGTTSLLGATSLSSGTVLGFNGGSLTIAGNYTSSGLLSSNSSSTLTLSGNTALTSSLSFSPSGNTVGTLVVNKTNAGTSATIGSALTVTSALTLTSGQLSIPTSTLSLSNGATLTRSGAGSIITNSPGGGPWNLVYTGASLTTGLEIPASGSVLSLNVNGSNSSVVTLNQNLIVTNNFAVTASGATFTSGNFNVSAGSMTLTGVLNAPGSGASTGLTLLGNFINNGTFTNNTGTVVIGGNLSMSGTKIATTNFNNITINSPFTLTAPTTLNIQGNFIDNGGFSAGTGSVVFSGSTSTTSIGGTTNTQFYDVTLNKSSSGFVVSVATPQTITHSLTLSAGVLDNPGSHLTVSSGATITRVGGSSITTASPGGGPWNLIYAGATQTTSLEIPTSGNLLSLTINTNNGATVTLSQNVSVTNGFSIPFTGHTFTSGNFNVSVGSFTSAGTFNAPGSGASTGLTLNGNFVNNGTYNDNGGTVVIAGNVTVSGTSVTTFNNVKINGGAVLTPPNGNLGVLGNFVNNGSFTVGTGTITFSGGNAAGISGTTNTSFYNLTINKSLATTVVSVTSPQTVTNMLTLTKGQLSITSSDLSMSSGSTLSRADVASVTSSSPAGGPWNLIYTGGTMTTGLEIPASGILLSLVDNMNSGQVLTLSQALTITNNLTITSVGTTFNAGTHSISSATYLSGGTFDAPSTTYTITGNFADNGSFVGGTGTVVFNGNSSLTGTSSTLFNHIQINATKTLNAPASLLLKGNFIDNGIFVAGTGTVLFNGSTTQNIQGSALTAFNNITVNNQAALSVSVQTNKHLAGILTLGNNVHVDADGSANTAIFTILSLNDHPVQDGSVANIPSTSAVTGNVTVQRYMGASDQDDRFISIPVTTASVAQLQDNFSVTGNFTGSSYPCTGCINNGPSLLYYDETVTGTFQDGYKATPVNDGYNTELLIPGRGYDSYMWHAPAPITWDVAAPINQQTINFTVTRTNSVPAQPTADGWNLLGNPYPSAIQWNTGAGWSSHLIDPTVYVWDRLINAERMWNESTLVGNLPNGIISSGQAFFVYANTGGTPSLSINEQAKIANQASTAYYRTSAKVNYSAIRISFSNQKSMDESYVVVYDDATPDYDQGLDAFKLETGKEALLVAPVDEEKRKLGFYALNEGYNKDIPLYLKAAKEGTCQLSFTNENQFKGFENLFLVDKYLGQSSRLSTPYQFTVTKNALTMENRFIISRNEVSSGDVETVLSVYPNPVSSQLSIEINTSQVQNVLFLDNMGRVMGQIPTTTDQGITRGTLNVGNFSSGLYFVRVWTKDKVLVEKVVIR